MPRVSDERWGITRKRNFMKFTVNTKALFDRKISHRSMSTTR